MKTKDEMFECDICGRKVSNEIMEQQQKSAENNEICDCRLYLQISQLQAENKRLLHSSDRRRIKNLIESIDRLEAENKELKDKTERFVTCQSGYDNCQFIKQAIKQERERIKKEVSIIMNDMDSDEIDKLGNIIKLFGVKID